MIADDEIASSTQYRDDRANLLSGGCPNEVSQFVSEILHQIRRRPDRVFMLDVCESNGKLYLVELNSFNRMAMHVAEENGRDILVRFLGMTCA